MREIRLDKVTVNIGVGEGGEKLAKAEELLATLTGRKPVQTLAKRTIRDFQIRKGEPIGVKVTLRGKEAEGMLERLFKAVDNRIPGRSFNGEGNFSFGIKEHIDIPGVKYDPRVGMFGMDVCVTLRRPGYRIKYRKRRSRPIPRRHRISREEAIKFVTEKFGVTVD